MIIYLNGSYVDEKKAKVSVFDHGFLYGDGVFEGIKASNNRVFALDEHVDRFFESAQAIQLDLPLTRQEMKEVIVETIRKNALKDAYVRLVASRGEGLLGLDPRNCKNATLVVIVEPETRHPEDTGSVPLNKKGIKVIVTTFRRNGPDVLSPRIKSLNYLNNVMAKLQANAMGAQDAVFLNAQGFVCELTGDNIFIVKNNRVYTPPLWQGILEGITRRVIIDFVNKLDLDIIEEPLTINDLYTCDECFCTATRIDILPIVWIDGRKIGNGDPGPITVRIMEGYQEILQNEGTPIY